LRAGHDVTFVARGKNLDALRAGGLHVTGAMGEFGSDRINATDRPADVEADLVVVCVKNYDLEAAAEAIRGTGDVVLTMQNGVEAPERARALLGDAVVAGSTGIVADLPEPGHVHCTSAYAWVRFGEVDGGGVTERVERVARWLDVEGVEPIPVPDARVALWEKMALMCAMAGLTTLHQRPMGEILGDKDLRASFMAIVEECDAVARARGVPLTDDFVEGRMTYAHGIDPAAMSSMSRDFARGRPIELETFNGAMVRMGAELGLDVPVNAVVYKGIRAAT
jgi:2-dehydropantoate 2-reductase